MRQIITLSCILALVVMGLPGVQESLTGATIGEVSNAEPTAFVPAGYAFSIWGLIYLALLVYGIYQALPRNSAVPVLRRTGWWVASAALASALWGYFYTTGLFVGSLVIMAWALISLIGAFVAAHAHEPLGVKNTWLVQIPISLFFGWITVATIANASDVLDRLGWDGFGLSDPIWAAIMVIAAALIASAVLVYRGGDVTYAAVLVWAFFAILVHQGELVGTAAIGAALVVATVQLITVFRAPKTPERARAVAS